MTVSRQARSRPRRRRRGRRLGGALAVTLALAAAPAPAHNVGDSYLYLQIYEDSLGGRFEIALSDLNPALGLEGTEEEITPDNLDQRIGFLQQYYRDRVAISHAGQPLSIVFTGHDLLAAGAGYVQLPFELGGLDGLPESLTFDYSVLFDEDPSHRGFLLVEHDWSTGTFANENRVSLVFSPGNRRQRFDLASASRWRGFLAVVRLGAEHVWRGLDHLVFLAALMLPAVLRRESGGWRAVDRATAVLPNLVRIVTAFLAAHALALALVALAGLRLPEGPVEAGIAASIAVAAACILFPRLGSKAWWTVFGLSLFHGFGFAAGLLDLGVTGKELALALVAFNLGVELGQVAVVLVLALALLPLRRLELYRRAALPAAAVAMMLLSGAWVVERSFGVDIPIRELLPASVQEVIP